MVFSEFYQKHAKVTDKCKLQIVQQQQTKSLDTQLYISLCPLHIFLGFCPLILYSDFCYAIHYKRFVCLLGYNQDYLA